VSRKYRPRNSRPLIWMQTSAYIRVSFVCTSFFAKIEFFFFNSTRGIVRFKSSWWNIYANILFFRQTFRMNGGIQRDTYVRYCILNAARNSEQPEGDVMSIPSALKLSKRHDKTISRFQSYRMHFRTIPRKSLTVCCFVLDLM
jgi:hypothetical protein